MVGFHKNKFDITKINFVIFIHETPDFVVTFMHIVVLFDNNPNTFVNVLDSADAIAVQALDFIDPM